MLLAGFGSRKRGHDDPVQLFVAHEHGLVVLAVGEVGEQHEGVGAQIPHLYVLGLGEKHQLVK